MPFNFYDVAFSDIIEVSRKFVDECVANQQVSGLTISFGDPKSSNRHFFYILGD